MHIVKMSAQHDMIAWSLSILFDEDTVMDIKQEM